MHLLELKNSELKVEINKVGAEIHSIQSGVHGIEYIWQGNPSIWNGRAPVLFPIIGALKNGQYAHNGLQYTLGKHGFIRHNPSFEIEKHTSDTLVLVLKSNADTIGVYPFDFKFTMDFTLEANQLRVSHWVENKSATDMYFSLGAHPAFNCPLDIGTYEDWFVEFNKSETASSINVNPNGLIERNTTECLVDSNILPLTNATFIKDALIFHNLQSNQVSLKSKLSERSVVMDFTGFPFMAFWAKPNAPYICFEPWFGIGDYTDASGLLQEKEGTIQLAPNGGFEAHYDLFFL